MAGEKKRRSIARDRELELELSGGLDTMAALLVLLLHAGATAAVAPRSASSTPPADVVDGCAAAASTFACGKARFTLLTDSLVRLEWSNASRFDDRPSLIFQNRATPPVTGVTVARPTAMSLTLTTGRLQLRFTPAKGDTAFSGANLAVSFDLGAGKGSWTFGDRDGGNLNGTLGSMDCYKSPSDCAANWNSASGVQPGLLSRAGWTLFDDTKTAKWGAASTPPAGSQSSWRWFDAGVTGDGQDFYLFAYGRRYTDALRDFAVVAGKPDFPPASAFGVWWSRYWVYSVNAPALAQDVVTDGAPLVLLVLLLALLLMLLTFNTPSVIDGYAANDLPLNHLVMDMNWHSLPSQYSWNNSLFKPSVSDFILNTLHAGRNSLGHPLKLLLNLHPNGVGKGESNWPQFSKEMGVTAKAKCDLSNPKFAASYFDWMMGANPRAINSLVDYWWTDWGGCGSPTGAHTPGISSLWWGNYLYHEDKSRATAGRGLVLSRFGGVGTHRYGVGFSGDSPQHWLMLKFQVHMTPMAANVLFGFWSHDIGGFHNGTVVPGFAKGFPYKGSENPRSPTDSELYLRWLQFATFAPIFRTHCQKEPIPQNHICDPVNDAHCIGCERRIWIFVHFSQMKDAMVMRNALAPYIYTAVQAALTSGVSLLHPAYYEDPEEEMAYGTAQLQYRFGQHMIVRPITDAFENATDGQRNYSTWLPRGAWTDWFGERTFRGLATVTMPYSHEGIPIFVAAGAAIPLKTMRHVSSSFPDLVWAVFPSAATKRGAGFAYDDDGTSQKHLLGDHTTSTLEWEGGCDSEIRVRITVASNSSAHPPTRSHALQLRGAGCSRNPSSFTINGAAVDIASPLPSTAVDVGDQGGVAGWARNSAGRSLTSGPSGTLTLGFGHRDFAGDIEAVIKF